MLHNMHLLESVQHVLEGLGGAGISNMPEDAVVLPGCCQVAARSLVSLDLCGGADWVHRGCCTHWQDDNVPATVVEASPRSHSCVWSFDKPAGCNCVSLRSCQRCNSPQSSRVHEPRLVVSSYHSLTSPKMRCILHRSACGTVLHLVPQHDMAGALPSALPRALNAFMSSKLRK